MQCETCASRTSTMLLCDGMLLCTACYLARRGLCGEAQGEPAAEAPHDRTKVASDGNATSYYQLPIHATELRHLISHKGMSKSRGDIFKACYRLGEKDGTDVLYDLNKMEFFIQDLKEMHKRGELL